MFDFFIFMSSDGPTFQSQSLTREVDTGNNITITCQVISNPVSNITWFKDGRLLLNNSDAVISTAVTTLDQFQAIVRSTLQLQVPNKNVTGNYSCQATRDTIVKRQETMVIARCKLQINDLDFHNEIEQSI